MNLKQVQFGAAHYVNEDTSKKQIYLHHTAGNDNAEGVFSGWEQTSARIATCVVINSEGVIVQGFPSNKWAYHLGLDTKVFNSHGLRYENLDKLSIGIELCNWGYVTKVGEGKDAKFLNYVNREVPTDQVIKLDKPYKGYEYWHSYTDAQIEAVKELLILWNQKYNIPLDYNEDIWAVTPRALAANPGVYTHNSVRKDKTDVYPHPKLIEMMKSLSLTNTSSNESSKPLADKPKAKSNGKSKK
jgi:N-acetyl-anhydromuramyl-L-alanine amidase AmpD